MKLITPISYIDQYLAGETEKSGPASNPAIQKIIRDCMPWVEPNVDDSKVAWCGCFMLHVLRQCDIDVSQIKHPWRAQAWVEYGHPSENLLYDKCIAVFRRGGKNSVYGHVGFPLREKEGKILLRGGNQSNGVHDRWYSKKSSYYEFLGYRLIPELNENYELK